MLLKHVISKCASIRLLCDERYAAMPCMRKYLHDFSAVNMMNEVCPSEVIADSHAFCTAYAECEEVDLIVQRFLEGI